MVQQKFFCRFCGGYLRTETSPDVRTWNIEDVCYDCKIAWEKCKEAGLDSLVYLIQKITERGR